MNSTQMMANAMEILMELATDPRVDKLTELSYYDNSRNGLDFGDDPQPPTIRITIQPSEQAPPSEGPVKEVVEKPEDIPPPKVNKAPNIGKVNEPVFSGKTGRKIHKFLDATEIMLVQKYLAEGVSPTLLANRFGVNPSTINNIKNGKLRRKVKEEIARRKKLGVSV